MRSLLDRIVAREPNHIMANHLQIHLFEDAADHSRSIAAANRLDEMHFAAEDEHLAHMPAHAWIDVGDYARAVASSRRAISYFDEYLAEPNADRAHHGYLAHDVSVGWRAALMLGNYASAKWFANRLAAIENTQAESLMTALRFGDRSAFVAATDKDAKTYRTYEDILQGDLAGSRAAFTSAFDPKDDDPLAWAIAGRLKLLEGDRQSASSDFSKAWSLEGSQFVGEELPSFPVGELEGFGYFRNGDYRAAETAFRHTLKRFSNDPRALYGLSLALQKDGRAAEAQRVVADFRKQWQGADTRLSVGTL